MKHKRAYKHKSSSLNPFSKTPFSKKSPVIRLISISIAVIAIGGAAVVGVRQLRSSFAYTGHHSSCSLNLAYVDGKVASSVQTGQTFKAAVWFLNNGDSTWSPNYGFYMGEYNGTNIWHATGNGVTTDYPPGTTAKFNLTLKAPSAPGTYAFSWSMNIVYQGQLQTPCIGQLKVIAPLPSTPSLKVIGSSASSINLDWNSTTTTTNYSVFRNNSQIATVTSSSYNNTGLKCNTSYSYYVKANGPGGSTKSNTVSKTTGACSSGGSEGGGSGGGTSGGSGGGTSGGSSGGSTSDNQSSNSGDTPVTSDGSDQTSTDTGTGDTSSTDFGNFGDQESVSNGSPLKTVLKVLLVLVIIGGVGFGGLYLLSKFATKRRAKAVYEDYWRKSKGL